MGKKETLLSIGDFSKVTGVSIKALRYYDEAGILTPAFVDSNSGYRYYAFSQKAIVDAVQFCVELGIPLKQFPEYTNEPVSWIRYADLVERGEEIVQGKIKTLQEHLALLKQMRKEIQRAESSCQSSLPARYCLPALLDCPLCGQAILRRIRSAYEQSHFGHLSPRHAFGKHRRPAASAASGKVATVSVC